MDPDLKMYLRTDERLATIVAAEMCETPAGGTLLCVAFELDGGGTLGDHFGDSNHLPCHNTENHRQESLGRATETKDRSQPLVGKQVIVMLDDRGNPERYRPPLAHQNNGGGRRPRGPAGSSPRLARRPQRRSRGCGGVIRPRAIRCGLACLGEAS